MQCFILRICDNWNIFVTVAPHRYRYFDVVVGLAWSNDPESYAGGSDATGMASRARQVKGDDPDKKGYPDPPCCGLHVRLTISPHKTYICWETSNIGDQTETTKMTQHEQGLTSGNVERAVSVWTWHTAELDQSNTRLWDSFVTSTRRKVLGRSIIEKGCRIHYSCDVEEKNFWSGLYCS